MAAAPTQAALRGTKMNGTTPLNISHKQARIECTSQLRANQKEHFPVRTVNQYTEHAPFTNISAENFYPHSSSSALGAKSAILSALHLQSSIDDSNAINLNARNNCAEICIYLLTNKTWCLNPTYYTNFDQIDILEGLYLAGETSLLIHAQKPELQGIFISYDGYSEARFTNFIKTKLDTTQRYIVRTGAADKFGGHFAVCFYDSASGWIIEDRVFGLQYLTDLSEHLTNFGKDLLAEHADWGPYNGQRSFIFIQATPRRIALLSEYLLRYRYYDQNTANAAMEQFDRQTGTFPPRPALKRSLGQHFVAKFQAPLPIPTDDEAKHFSLVCVLHTCANQYVSYENRSAERALMALVANKSIFNVNYNDVADNHAIDLVDALTIAGELNVAPKTDSHDDFVDTPLNIGHSLQKLNKNASFLLRVGINEEAGYYLALRYFDKSIAAQPGWYYYGTQHELQTGNQEKEESWFLLADVKGKLFCKSNLLSPPQHAVWGKEDNNFSLQFIEATEIRQHILQNYVSYLRYVSNEAAFAFLEQRALARKREIADKEQTDKRLEIQNFIQVTYQHLIGKHALSFDQLYNNLNTEEQVKGQQLKASFDALSATSALPYAQQLDDITEFILADLSSSPSVVSQAVCEGDASFVTKKHIDLLNSAINNSNELNQNKTKFMAIKMMLENRSDEDIIVQCRNYWKTHCSKNLFLDSSRLLQMRDYYLKGGLLLLRGYSITSFSTPHSAEVFHLFVALMLQDRNLSDEALIRRFEADPKIRAKKVVTPCRTTIVRFFERCGFIKKKRNSLRKWCDNPNLTVGISTENLEILTNKQRSQIFTKKTTKHLESFDYHQKIRIETKQLRMKIAQAGSLIFDDELLHLQKNELLKAMQNHHELPKNKMKFKVVLEALSGLTTHDIQQNCDFYANQHGVQKIIITDKTLASMREYYAQGGLTLLRGYVQAPETMFGIDQMKYLLDLLEKDPHTTTSELHRGLSLAISIGILEKKLIPSIYAIRHFLERCGYIPNLKTNKWK